MDQKDQGSGSSSNVPPPKRKRGRPRKYQTVVHDVENMTRNETTDHPMVGNLATTHHSMAGNLERTDFVVGSFVHGVVEGTFGAGYLVNVKLLGEPDSMRGVVFKPDQVNPVTPENDVAPHLKMIKRTNVPIPVLQNTQTGVPVPGFSIPVPSNTQTEVHGSGPSSVQNRQTGLPGFVPMTVLPNTQTEVHGSGSSSVLSRHTGGSGFVPMQVLPNRQAGVHGSGPSSVPVTEINSGISVSVEKDLPMSEEPDMLDESDKTAKQGDALHEVDASTKVKESTADGGVTRGSKPASPTIEDTDKELSTEQQGDALHELDDSTKVKESAADGGLRRDSRSVSPTIEDTDMELRTEQQCDMLHEPDVDTSTKVKQSSADGDGEATRDYSRPVSDSISLVQTNEDTDKELITEQQGDTLHELDASTEVKESGADDDGGARRDYSRPASDSISLVQTTEDTAKELRTEQQAVPSVHQLDQLVHEEPGSSNIEIPASGGPESMQSEDSEQISKSVDNIGKKQDSPKTDLLDTKTETDLPTVSD